MPRHANRPQPARPQGRLKQNIHTLPLTSMALAGLLGAGITALCMRSSGKHDGI